MRDWDTGIWGSQRNTTEEDRKVYEDDVMMWRFFTIALMALHVRRAQDGSKEDVLLLLEQPAEPEEFPEAVSFWRTGEWKKLKNMYKWGEQTFRQGHWGGKSPKPTTIGGSLKLRMPRKKEIPKERSDVKDSKNLERWAPRMMREVARAIHGQVQGGNVEEGGVAATKLSWDEHLRLGRMPFRRDCYICQQSRQKKKEMMRSRRLQRMSFPRRRDPTEGRQQRMRFPRKRGHREGRLHRMRDPQTWDPKKGRIRMKRIGRLRSSGCVAPWPPRSPMSASSGDGV